MEQSTRNKIVDVMNKCELMAVMADGACESNKDVKLDMSAMLGLSILFKEMATDLNIIAEMEG